ncbi:MAG: hypothetical protein MUO82_01935 [Candidatus Thermoplasmatota archaeon]|nr:hypothetical protein [Candidatus Thermoplasmatota archaeon]
MDLIDMGIGKRIKSLDEIKKGDILIIKNWDLVVGIQDKTKSNVENVKEFKVKNM